LRTTVEIVGVRRFDEARIWHAELDACYPPYSYACVSNLISKVLLKTFVWLGSRLFRSVVIYSPDDAEGNVLAIHFGVSQQAIANSCRELSENSLA
jgi:hypothetical protein